MSLFKEVVEVFKERSRNDRKSHDDENLRNQVDWCSAKAREIIDRFRLEDELGIGSTEDSLALLLDKYLLERILSLQAYALDEIGRGVEAVGLRRKADQVRRELSEPVGDNPADTQGYIRAQSIRHAVHFFMSLGTVETQGQLGLGISMPSERMELWRRQVGILNLKPAPAVS